MEQFGVFTCYLTTVRWRLESFVDAIACKRLTYTRLIAPEVQA